QIKYGYIKMILSAKEYVYIQTPYYIPDESLRDALRIAVLSGVRIKMMIPNKPDHPFVYWATLSYIADLLQAGAEVYIYQGGFLHAKTLVVDGKIASVGTANIDVRSFRLNFEVNAFLYDKQIAQKLVAAFKADIKQSTQMTKKLYQQRSLDIRFKESISRLLAPVLYRKFIENKMEECLMKQEAKPCSYSLAVKIAHDLPPDTNAYGTMFGGKLLAYIDDVAAIAAVRHARQPVVTASMDS